MTVLEGVRYNWVLVFVLARLSAFRDVFIIIMIIMMIKTPT